MAQGEGGAVRIIILFACVMLAGCAAPRVELQRVSVTVPVACQEPMPSRPVMPTESLRPPVALDAFAAAAMAEIERRTGYEIELVTALEACRAPIAVKPAGGLGLKQR